MKKLRFLRLLLAVATLIDSLTPAVTADGGSDQSAMILEAMNRSCSNLAAPAPAGLRETVPVVQYAAPKQTVRIGRRPIRTSAKVSAATEPAAAATQSAVATVGSDAHQAVVAQTAATPTPLPIATPIPTSSAVPTPGFPVPPRGPVQFTPPNPAATPQVTAPPIPTPSPQATGARAPVFLIRTKAEPTIAPAPAGAAPATVPSPAGASPVPTLGQGEIAVIADRIKGTNREGEQSDAYGNVHIFYADDVLIGDRAHYDGQETITVSGNPYIVNNAHNSLLHADLVTFDTRTQIATLTNGRGQSSQGVEVGKVYFGAKQMTSTRAGVAEGTNATVTTCANPRGGYHITGRTIDVKPGDRMTISKAVLFLGAAALFYIPRVVIPLNRTEQERTTSFFPVLGYNQYEGAYMKVKYGFGKDQNYYGYYRLDFFTKVGLGLGYVGFYSRRDGRRRTSADFYTLRDKRTQTRSYNLTALDEENFSRNTRARFNFLYNGLYGPFTFVPPSETLSATLVHTGSRAVQTYQFDRFTLGPQRSINLGFIDQRRITNSLTHGTNISFSRNSNSYGGLSFQNSTVHINTLTSLLTPFGSYDLTIDKTNTASPFGVNKLPELAIRPRPFTFHGLPLSPQFTIGNYNEPQNKNFTTSRAEMNLGIGPLLYHMLGGDFTGNITIRQDAYGTGDLKAQVIQNYSLTTPIGRHILNSISYNSQHNAGPLAEPFQTLDTLGLGSKSAQDVIHFFNADYYDLMLVTGTQFNRQAQPVGYQLTTRPSRRSYFSLGGTFIPGPGNGFGPTNIQIYTPFGYETELQFGADIDWKHKGRITDKTIYYRKTIGECYNIRIFYQQALKQINVSFDLLAFPSRSASFGIGQNGPIIPQSFNF